jgi:hypothetical protein
VATSASCPSNVFHSLWLEVDVAPLDPEHCSSSCYGSESCADSEVHEALQDRGTSDVAVALVESFEEPIEAVKLNFDYESPNDRSKEPLVGTNWLVTDLDLGDGVPCPKLSCSETVSSQDDTAALLAPRKRCVLTDAAHVMAVPLLQEE